jgi:hypothetical protein
MYNSGNSSKNVTGASIVDGTVETVDIADDAVTADKLANTVNADIATGVSGSTTAGDALPKAGGTMTGTIAGFESTGIDDNATSTAITIDASENVGIGTATPSTDLHVVGKSTVRNTVVSNFTLDGGVSATNPYDGFGFGVNFQGRDYGNAIRDYAYVYSVMEATDSNAGGGDAGFTAGLRFYTNSGGASGTLPTEKLHINAAGDVTVNTGNLVIGTSGKGIDFSATSDGSGTMTSEVLDDYEEGTWTPTSVTGDVTSFGNATYTKIGRVVTITVQAVRLSDFTTAAAITLGGLPYAQGTGYSVGSVMVQNKDTTVSVVSLIASTTITFYENTTGAFTALQHTGLTSASNQFYFTMTYHT